MDLAKIFTSAGLKYVEHGNWRARVRPGTFTPEGAMVHHTASSDLAATLKVVTYGRPDLIGPLCNVLVDHTGLLHLISAGRANHAGMGSSKVLAHMKQGQPPKGTARQLGYKDDIVGNGLFVGFEVLSTGKATDPLPQAAWVATAKATAAICRYLKHPTPARVIGHAEWTSRKPDPQFGRGPDAHINMDRLRQAIRPYVVPR
jgi:hypothetical protein